ncbi:hypothetical protein EYC80_004265 [Monilinia laxa]|uniref:Uncharacterized protein n=1 Tax=Monilinia laxa TaxID=61186 RepID=A0A5N6KMM4_MONLA|nr:hypothetical protein EYC80_004265 [Monilinia laxa]
MKFYCNPDTTCFNGLDQLNSEISSSAYCRGCASRGMLCFKPFDMWCIAPHNWLTWLNFGMGTLQFRKTFPLRYPK